MHVGADISEWTGYEMVSAFVSFVFLRMIDNFLFGMCIVAVYSMRAHIEITVLHIRVWDDVWAHGWFVVVCERVTTKPAPVDIHVTEGT